MGIEWFSAAGFGCHAFGGGRLVAMAARAGNVGAGAKVVVIGQTIPAKMNLMDFAVDHWGISASVTPATAPLLGAFSFTCSAWLTAEEPGLEINSAGCDQ